MHFSLLDKTDSFNKQNKVSSNDSNKIKLRINCLTVVILSCLHSSVPTQHFNGFLLYLTPPPPPEKNPPKIMVLHFSVLTRISTISIPLFHNTCSAKFHFLFFFLFFEFLTTFIQGKEVLNLHLNKASETHVSETHCICHYFHYCLHVLQF